MIIIFQFSGYLTTCLGDTNNPGPDGICLLVILAGFGNIHSNLWIPFPQRNRKINCADFYSTYSQRVICSKLYFRATQSTSEVLNRVQPFHISDSSEADKELPQDRAPLQQTSHHVSSAPPPLRALRPPTPIMH